jgi:hypothetical protein
VIAARRALLLALPAGAARADTLDPRLAAQGWRLRAVSGRAAAVFEAGEGAEVRVRAERAVGFLVRPFAAPPGPLAWRWRVDAAPPPTELARRGGDDRPLALHLLFADAAAGPMAALRRAMRGALLPEGAAGKALTYVWGGAAPGGPFPNPYAPGEGALIVRRGAEAPLGTWCDEAADVAGDFARAFGAEAPTITHIALSADTDDAGGLALARILPPAPRIRP